MKLFKAANIYKLHSKFKIHFLAIFNENIELIKEANLENLRFLILDCIIFDSKRSKNNADYFAKQCLRIRMFK